MKTSRNQTFIAVGLFLKRIFDILAALVGAALIAIPGLCIAVGVRWFLGAPILFRQIRPGLHGKPFVMYKFRTMTEYTDEEGFLLPDAERLTTFGRFLRSTSLDELPEVLNVLKGDMSIVGPRPLLMQYLTEYSPDQAKRHDMRPGITGLAQISGRASLSWEERFSLDVSYVESWSLKLDLYILLKTIGTVIRQEGVDSTVLPPFKAAKISDG